MYLTMSSSAAKPRFGVEPVAIDGMEVDAPYCPHGELQLADFQPQNDLFGRAVFYLAFSAIIFRAHSSV